MSGYIKDSFIKRIKEDADIVSIIGQYVPLKRTGSTYKGRCPFHNEKTPSFHVNPSMHFYHCFGCGKSGDILSFLQEMNNLDFSDAVEQLASMEGLNVEYEERGFGGNNRQKTSYDEKKQVYECLKDAANFYYLNMKKNPEAYRYLTERGLKVSTIKGFGLGYSAPGFDILINYLTKKKGHALETLIKAGLAKKNDRGNVFDFFRDRIMFPIVDVNNRVIGFGGRIFKGEKNSPKYINSSETIVFKKDNNLYNLNKAKNELKEKPLILVEGYMDVISLVDAGVNNCVATLGTAFNRSHARVIKRYTDNIVIIYDSDSAGEMATVKASRILEEEELYPKVVRLPLGDDPDSYIQKNNVEQFEYLIKNSIEAVEFRLKLLEKQHNMLDNWEKVDYVKKACLEIGNLKDNIRKEYYTKYLHNQSGIEISSLVKEINSGNHLSTNDVPSRTERKPENVSKAKHKILQAQTVILKYMADLTLEEDDYGFEMNEDYLVGKEYKELYDYLENLLNSGKKLDMIDMFDYNDKLATTMSAIVALDKNITDEDIQYAMKILEINYINKKIDKVKIAIKGIQESGDKDLLDVLIAEFYKLKAQLVEAKNGGAF